MKKYIPFEYTTKSGRLTIQEVFNGYQLRNNANDDTCGFGDGTNYVSPDDDDLDPEEAEQLKRDRMIDDLEHIDQDLL